MGFSRVVGRRRSLIFRLVSGVSAWNVWILMEILKGGDDSPGIDLGLGLRCETSLVGMRSAWMA